MIRISLGMMALVVCAAESMINCGVGGEKFNVVEQTFFGVCCDRTAPAAEVQNVTASFHSTGKDKYEIKWGVDKDRHYCNLTTTAGENIHPKHKYDGDSYNDGKTHELSRVLPAETDVGDNKHLVLFIHCRNAKLEPCHIEVDDFGFAPVA